MSSKATFHKASGEIVDLPIVTATRAKTIFGELLEQVADTGVVGITRHNRPRAVLVAYDEFDAWRRERAASLERLTASFEGMARQMQLPEAKRGVREMLDSSPQELGRAALLGCYSRQPDPAPGW